ncbi:ATP-sensitive inward rectifier potassium channel 1-like [Electrophorus electricus]|uniref:ATP-sensitive inward rectifier potassium channel 1-like n=1 Tax=Electrophorus electricus TaxID=8005 RepID=UPI0015CFBDE4|nr:ATP-sensitive inward rectifier potassium channel 1-like [Electrophorus electricus]
MTRTLPQLFRDYLDKRQINRNRLVTKDGHCNIEYGNVKYSSRLAYLLDIWTTTLELRWTIVFILFGAAFLLSFFLFALIWYWIARSNGDLWWQNPSPDHNPCVMNVYGLTTAFLYSITTQMTIGYTARVITPYCPGALVVLNIQTLIGTLVKCYWCGVVIAKMASPKKRAKTINFSEKAVISPRNGALCLQIRVANLRKTILVGSQIYGKMFRTTVTPDGETIIMDQITVDFMVDAGKDNLFFVCPLTLYHVIDRTSPFFEMAADTLHQQQFELVVFLDGTDETTNFSCQARTSYIPREIMWGYEFFPIISRSKEGTYCVDFSMLARLVPTPTPHCIFCFSNERAHHYDPRGGTDNLDFEACNTTNQDNIDRKSLTQKKMRLLKPKIPSLLNSL